MSVRVPGGYNPANVAITGGSITGVSGVSYLFSRSFVPVLIAPTGSMANNGAVTMGTALPAAYPNCFVIFPAGAIAAGVPAAAAGYFVQMSTTTAGVVFNNLLSANVDATGAPTIPASPTAFATTGPGAFTGLTTTQTLVTLTLPAATMGASGIVDIDANFSYNNNANNKLTMITFGGSNVVNANEASTAITRATGRVANQGSASAQMIFGFVNTGAAINGGNIVYGTVNTGNAVSIVLSGNHGAAATDVFALEGFSVMVTK